VRAADVILVLDQGRIVETGTYDQLAARRGHFAGMLKARPGTLP
jgi:ABC-type multidrug transport system fused ATPase/permease subunit